MRGNKGQPNCKVVIKEAALRAFKPKTWAEKEGRKEYRCNGLGKQRPPPKGFQWSWS